MLVQDGNFEQALNDILGQSIISVDTETTGLRPFHGDKPFAIIIATKENVYYFPVSDRVDPSLFVGLRRVFESTQIHKIFHNAQFDLHMLKTIGFEVYGKKYDLWVLARLENNQHLSYSLDQIAKRRGLEKFDSVKEYVRTHKLKKTVEVPELNHEITTLGYEHVPLETMQPYAEQDARITYDIGTEILGALLKDEFVGQRMVVENESELIDTIFSMEQLGVKIDKNYCWNAVWFYAEKIETARKKFKEMTGYDFVKGTTVFKEVFKGEKFTLTEKGNPQFDSEAMASFKHPAAKVVIEFAEAKKQQEYFQNFLFFADANDEVHASFLQAGTATGRFSSRSPNLQNLTNPDKYEEKSEASEFTPRAAFIPRDGFFFVSIDFDQIEYRVMLDRARARGLISKIKSGLDVHEATAQAANVSRKDAKTCNFLTLYGGGKAKLAAALGKSLGEATRIQSAIFSASPEIGDFIQLAQNTAKRRKWIFNFLGRRYQFPDEKWAYKAPNHLIQGECADILKVAMNRIYGFLSEHKSRMILTIHDELVFEIAYGEEHLISEIVHIMETTYSYKSLPLSVSVEYSCKNLADKSPWPPTESSSAARNQPETQSNHAP